MLQQQVVSVLVDGSGHRYFVLLTISEGNFQ
jgi:hypothetical protein